MTSSKLFLRAFCLSIPAILSGCSHYSVDPSRKVDLSEQAASGDYSKTIGQNSSLLVGLKPYLGRGTSDLRPAESLRLKSTGKLLILKDASGLVHKSHEITISWRKVPLSTPKMLRRQVIGPFASFESAERVALQLENAGISTQIAHPQEWELWAAYQATVPKAINALPWKQTLTSEVQPVLKGASGHRLVGPIKIEAPDGVQFNDGVYMGPFWLQKDAYGSWTFVEHVPLERYLLGVVPHEIGPAAPSAALAAQAVLARTWALANRHRFAVDGYHLCSDTQCQVYKDPRQASKRVRNAITNTAGKYLSWRNKPIHSVYHASNGGVMASANEAWSMSSVPYLKARLDGSKEWVNSFPLPLKKKAAIHLLKTKANGAYGRQHSRFRWTRNFDAEKLKNALISFKVANKFPGQVKVLDRGISGRVLALEILAKDKSFKTVLKLDEIRRVLPDLPSTLFVVNELKDGSWQFFGGGFGHGVGMSQSGAIDLAMRGWKTSQILQHYYPGTTYGTLQDLPKAP
ncbi:SpoIID/LytB domain-containing protein [Prochlorococcus sp. MIT 1307]|uniref:SpoIID/LytB domain-containing protein n=1 Tax=Prochlorococcus sp. MIT 1307 TaxID=3096219 RepID=UPI002A754262|nr:SpoIID/LytB domain-containing protein [Prochlorococcus sp. MIT 1307]